MIIGVITSVMVDRSFFATRRWDPQIYLCAARGSGSFGDLDRVCVALRREASCA